VVVDVVWIVRRDPTAALLLVFCTLRSGFHGV
jgi:hypothetical protein